ncbi:MAG: hypothetical protein ACREMZ_13900 [Gemmatimonadales bacterium]
MCPSRLTPFDLVFKQVAQETFPKIRSALHQSGQDARDRDRFLLQPEAVTLLRELRPDEGLGEGIDQLVALLHHAYLFWDAGETTVELSEGRLASLLATPPAEGPADSPPSYYAQVPARKMWAPVIAGQPHEPLDGCFVHLAPDGATLRVLGVFGIHPERQGFSVVEAMGARPAALERRDGSPLFSPALPGGAAAGLYSIAGEEELVDLGWRTRAVGAESWAGAGPWRA